APNTGFSFNPSQQAACHPPNRDSPRPKPEEPNIPMDTDDDGEEHIVPASHEDEVRKLRNKYNHLSIQHNNLLDGARNNARITQERLASMEASMNDMQERFRQAMEQQQQQYQQTINEQQNRIDRLTTPKPSKMTWHNSRMASAESKVLHASRCLTGNALTWFEPKLRDFLGNEPTEETQLLFAEYENFEEAIRRNFGTIDEEQQATQKLKNLRQTKAASTYAAEFTQITSFLNWGTSALQIAYEGLKDEVKDELCKTEKPDNLQDYIDMTIKIDNRQFERRMEKSNKGRIWGNKNNANQSRRREQTRGNTSYGTHAGPMELGAAQKDSKDIECYYCHKKGHKANECRKKQRDTEEGRYQPRPRQPLPEGKKQNTWDGNHSQSPTRKTATRQLDVTTYHRRDQTRRTQNRRTHDTPSAQQPSNEQADFQEAAAEGFDHKKWIVGYEEKEQLLVPATVHRRDCRQDDPTRCNHTLCPRHQIEASREYDEICERQKQTNTADCHAMIGLPRQAVATSIEQLEHKARQLQRELRQERSRKPRKSDKELWEEEDYPQLYDENNNRSMLASLGCRANTIGAKPTERRSKSKIASPSHYHINQTINPTYGTKRKGTKWYTGEETDHHKIEDWQKTISQENEEDPGAEQERQYQDWLHKKDDTHDYDACANSELDSGAEQNYFDPTTANRLRLPWRYKQTPYSVVNPEGTPFDYNNGIIDSEIDHLKVFVEGKNQGISFDVVPNKQHDLVLGYPWLQRFNPHFDWKTGQVLSFNDETPSTANDDSEYDTRSQTSTEGTGEARQRPTRDTSPPTGTRHKHQKGRKRQRQRMIARVMQQFHELEKDLAPQKKPQDNPEEEERLKNIPWQYRIYKKLFAEELETGLPEHTHYDLEIEFIDGKQPGFSKLYPLNEAQLPVLKEYIEDMIRKGYIRESKSSVGYPVMMLNAITVKDRTPLPLISELKDRLFGMKYFTALDLKGAYNLIRIKEGHEWKTAFRTKYGLFEYLVMPFDSPMHLLHSNE
ncbi:Integrase catalytic domain-containing protein, partial [Fusarium phalaenopsidis]